MAEIIIRHSEADDLISIKQLHESPNVYFGTLQLPFPSIENWEKRLNAPPPGRYNLVADMAGEIVGHLGFEVNQIPRRRHVGSFGIAVKDTHQGTGVGGKLLTSAVDFADNWLNLNRLEITVYTDNEAAIKLYQKYGFRIEGEAPYFAYRNGDYVSVYYMARIRGV
ncbi:GNAT family N-acetyltransferase [Telmatospirillum sp.]|uniref:GNAT family N-acetyltransferase n=1 Tax=Telmatospirillum sp. TaxID=2079197 RepID=UPI00284BA84D|nr:GNAT family N-acetyltransferase [Telmatospirillum sp.]MDR3440995.1 GNAT family N-acetyltransferase [Telmatospirillum sp.]